MALPRDLVREHFEQQSDLWKEIYESEAVEAAVYRTRQDRVLAMLEQIPVAAGSRVLELGCGAGWNVAALAQRGFRVHAVDLVPQMLANTLELSRSQGTADLVSVCCADAEALPFANASFDLVIGIALLEWISSAALFAEIARVLQPGGFTILTATNRWSFQRCLDPYLNPALESVKNALRRVASAVPGGARAHSRTHSLAEIDTCLAAAGLIRQCAITAGFGPFTFLKYKLMPGVRGARLHQMLQRYAGKPGATVLSRAGYAHIVLGAKQQSMDARQL